MAWEPFSEPARNLIVAAQEIAFQRESATIKPEHFLLAILRDSDSVGLLALKSLDVDVGRMRECIEEACRNDERTSEPTSVFSPTAKRTIELAFEASYQLGHNYIGTGHFLVGMLECSDSRFTDLLKSFSIHRSQLLEEVARFEALEKPKRFNLRESLAGGFRRLCGQLKNF